MVSRNLRLGLEQLENRTLLNNDMPMGPIAPEPAEPGICEVNPPVNRFDWTADLEHGLNGFLDSINARRGWRDYGFDDDPRNNSPLNAFVEHDPELGKPVLRIHHQANSGGTSVANATGQPRGGAQIYGQPWPEDASTVFLSYDLKLGPNFDPVKGGKIGFGFAVGENHSGGRFPDGKAMSIRPHTRKTSVLGITSAPGIITEVYVYMLDPISRQGIRESIGRGNFHLIPDVWHNIGLEMSLNSPDQANGELRVWFNYKLVIERIDLLFVTDPNPGPIGLFSSNFFGGDDQSYATDKPENVFFTELYAAERRDVFRIAAARGIGSTPIIRAI